MSRFIDIDGKRYVWREILRLRREQLAEHAKAGQPALFALREDHRPELARTAAGRYLAPSLLSLLDEERGQA